VSKAITGVCLFVRMITQKRTIPKSPNLRLLHTHIGGDRVAGVGVSYALYRMPSI